MSDSTRSGTPRFSGLVLLVTLGLAGGALGVLAQGCSSDASDGSSSFAVDHGAGSNEDAASGQGDDGTGALGDDGGAGQGTSKFGTGGGSVPDAAPPCVNLQCQQVACANGAHTTVSGTIYDPAGKDPLYDVVVYVPNSTPTAFVDHATCDTCAALYSGDPIVTALTGPDGTFTLKDVPAGTDIPLVIQIGKWRRQITIPTVTSCVDNALTDPTQTRLPRNHTEGDIPKIAVSTGSADSMECLLQRIGVDDAEYGGGAASTGRIHIFQGNGKGVTGTNTASDVGLWDSATDLTNYDMVVLSCEGGEHAETKPAASLQALEQYANAGGRVLASHFHYYWFEGTGAPADFKETGTWFPGSNMIPNDKNTVTSAAIDTSFPKGKAFAQWMALTDALQTDGTMQIDDSRQNVSVSPTANPASQTWLTDTTVPTAPNSGPTTMYFTFNTPTTVVPASQCGRVVFSDLHVGAASDDYSNGQKTVPAGCTVGDLTPQEKALEFMLFDLSSCVVPDSQPPTAPPPTAPPVK